MDKKNIILMNDCCLLNKESIYLFGQHNCISPLGQYYMNIIKDIKVVNKENGEEIISGFKCCQVRPDFCIKLKTRLIDKIDITINNSIIFKDIQLKFPFENIQFLESECSNLNIISTMCKNYNHRLDEWIRYHLKLGFDGIVIFDNSKNKKSSCNEGHSGNEDDIKIVTDKYKEKVLVIDYPYQPLDRQHYDNLQRISLHLGTNAFKDRCKYITLIDADEFIHLPNEKSIMDISEKYDKTIQIQSNILTNKNDKDIIDNNILSICKYIGENKYNKVMLRTSRLGNYYNGHDDLKWIISPHEYPEQITVGKDEIIHYHCWVNTRYQYKTDMKYIDLL